MRNNTVSKVEKLQGRIMSLALIGTVMTGIVWISIGVLLFMAGSHIEAHGLKHLIDTIWLGSGR